MAGKWYPERGISAEYLPLVNIDPDNIPWEESLVQRPSK